MKKISWAQIIQGYRDHIISHNLRTKTDKQLQKENIGSCRTCNQMKGIPSIAFSTFFSIVSQNLLAKEEKDLTKGILKIINKLLTTFVYKAPPTRVLISSVQFSFRLNWYWTDFSVIGSVNLPKFQFQFRLNRYRSVFIENWTDLPINFKIF